jgi:hypothetical protein
VRGCWAFLDSVISDLKVDDGDHHEEVPNNALWMMMVMMMLWDLGPEEDPETAVHYAMHYGHIGHFGTGPGEAIHCCPWGPEKRVLGLRVTGLLRTPSPSGPHLRGTQGDGAVEAIVT